MISVHACAAIVDTGHDANLQESSAPWGPTRARPTAGLRKACLPDCTSTVVQVRPLGYSTRTPAGNTLVRVRSYARKACVNTPTPYPATDHRRLPSASATLQIPGKTSQARVSTLRARSTRVGAFQGAVILRTSCVQRPSYQKRPLGTSRRALVSSKPLRFGVPWGAPAAASCCVRRVLNLSGGIKECVGPNPKK